MQGLLQPPLDPISQLPITLPAANVPMSGLKSPTYGLSSVAAELLEPGSTLAVELVELEAWSRAPLRLDRPTHYKPMLQQRSWAVVYYSALGFLGFMYTYCRQASPVTLALYRDHFGPGFMRFMSFLRARRCHGGTFCQHCQAAERVLYWLR